MVTIGVSIAVPDPFGRRLQDYRIGLGDEQARLIPTHITLVSPHQLADDDVEAVHRHLATVAAASRSFHVHLRGTGSFRPTSAVVFVGVVEGISACERLAAALRQGPLAVVSEFPYHPHVTVAHNLDDATLDRAFTELAGTDAHFEVGEFWLYVHTEQNGWQPVQSYALGRTAPAPSGSPEESVGSAS